MKAASWMGHYSLLLGNEPPLKEGTLSSGCKGPQCRDHPPTGPPGHRKTAGQDRWWRQEHRLVTQEARAQSG